MQEEKTLHPVSCSVAVDGAHQAAAGAAPLAADGAPQTHRPQTRRAIEIEGYLHTYYPVVKFQPAPSEFDDFAASQLVCCSMPRNALTGDGGLASAAAGHRGTAQGA